MDAEDTLPGVRSSPTCGTDAGAADDPGVVAECCTSGFPAMGSPDVTGPPPGYVPAISLCFRCRCISDELPADCSSRTCGSTAASEFPASTGLDGETDTAPELTGRCISGDEPPANC